MFIHSVYLFLSSLWHSLFLQALAEKIGAHVLRNAEHVARQTQLQLYSPAVTVQSRTEIASHCPSKAADVTNTPIPEHCHSRNRPFPNTGFIKRTLLCSYCRNITLSSLMSPSGHAFHPTWIATERSAKSGCPLCTALTDLGVWIGVTDGRLYPLVRFPGIFCVSEETRERLRGVKPGRLHAIEVFEGAGKGLVGMAEVNGDEVWFYKGLRLGEGQNCDEISGRHDIPVRRQPTYTGSASSFETVRRWLANCDAQHHCHPEPVDTHWKTPASRLLDVEAFGKPCLDLRLVETEREENIPEYIALSYRWGTSGRRFITTRATLRERLNRVPFDSLPLTFQHSVQIARELGVRYLWIDSLCIIQDDSEDWAIESGRMGLIYAHSYITIAADSGRSSDGGLFNAKSVLPDEEPFGKHVVLRVQAREEGENAHILYVSDERNVPSNFGPQEMFSAGVGEEDEDPDRMLVTRGWTLQEAVLAPRVLHYTSKQLIWECPERGYHAEDIASVALRYARPTYTELKSLLQVRHEISIQTKIESPVGRRLKILKAWYIELIELRYTTRRLTYEDDKLPAIAGLASLTAPTLGCQYIAGMWQTEMEWALTWRSVQSDAALVAVEDIHTSAAALKAKGVSGFYRSPTFSWASSFNRVSWDYALETFKSTAVVEDVNVELDCDNLPFGRVREGCWTRVTGFLCEHTITPSDGWNCFIFENCGGAIGKIHLDRSLESLGKYREGPPRATVTSLELGLGSGPELRPDELYQEMRRRSCQLILIPVDGKPGSYTRVGFADSWEVGSKAYAGYTTFRERRTVTIY